MNEAGLNLLLEQPAVLRQVLHLAGRTELRHFVAMCFKTLCPGDEYRWNWHIDAMAYELEQCLGRQTRRLIINLPPRNLKSIITSVAFVAYALGRSPALQFMCVSYSQDLSAKHARDCRTIMKSDWYRRMFPGTVLASDAEGELRTTKGGFRLATSVGGTITGRGANFIIIDDPMDPGQAMSDTVRESVRDWYDKTLYTRLNQKLEDVIIMVMQRLHRDDLTAHVLEKERWKRICLPAIAVADEAVQVSKDRWVVRKVGDLLHPEREPHRVLADLKNNLRERNFLAQYQQLPVPPDGDRIKLEWFRTYDSLPSFRPDELIQSWDTAFKTGELNDYSVCVTLGVKQNTYYLLDIFRQRLLAPDLLKAAVAQFERFRPGWVLIEDVGSGTGLIQQLRAQAIRGLEYPVAVKPAGEKIVRIDNQVSLIERGQVLVPKDASWLEPLFVEAQEFPNGRHDDILDSLAQALRWDQERYKEPPISLGGPINLSPPKPEIISLEMRGGTVW